MAENGASGEWRVASGKLTIQFAHVLHQQAAQQWRAEERCLLRFVGVAIVATRHYVRRTMNDENPFQPPGVAHVTASEPMPKRSKAAIIGLFVLMLITYVINGPLATFLLGLMGIPAMDIMVLFGREIVAVYVVISSLSVFKCSIKTYVITSAIVIAALFVRAYIECLDYGSMDGLLNFWIFSSAVAMATPYLYVAEAFLIRRMKSTARP